jgi:hypothetical protein
LLRALVVASVATCLALVAGCGGKPAVSRSNLATNLGGNLEVKASVDGPGFISSDGKAAVVTFAGGKLAVEKGAVKLDGELLAKLPEDTRKVEADYTAGKLTVTADGKSVASREIRK